MDAHQLTTKVMEHEAALAAHKEELKTLFTQQKNIESIAKSTQEIAESVRELTLRVNELDEQLDILDTDKRNRGFAIWQALISALIGGGITYLITLAVGG